MKNWLRLASTFLPVVFYWIILIFSLYQWFLVLSFYTTADNIPLVIMALIAMFGLIRMGWRMIHWHALELEERGLMRHPMAEHENEDVVFLPDSLEVEDED